MSPSFNFYKKCQVLYSMLNSKNTESLQNYKSPLCLKNDKIQITSV